MTYTVQIRYLGRDVEQRPVVEASSGLEACTIAQGRLKLFGPAYFFTARRISGESESNPLNQRMAVTA